MNVVAKKENSITLPEGYKPSDSEEYMCDLHLEYFRLKLLEWRDELGKESQETLDHLSDENFQLYYRFLSLLVYLYQKVFLV